MHTFSQYFKQPLQDGTTLIKNSNDPDFNAVVSDGGTDYYLYINWEDRPRSMSRIKLDSSYSVTAEGMLDFSSVDSTWVNCFGTVSLWGTPLSSEELYFDITDERMLLFIYMFEKVKYLGSVTLFVNLFLKILIKDL